MSAFYSLGLDFGTSNSCLTYATFDRSMDGKMGEQPRLRPEAVLFDHEATIPSVVFLGNGSGEANQFGRLAEERAAAYPERTKQGFKLYLGEDSDRGREAYELTCKFLRYLRERVAEFVPLDRPNVEAETIVGHPVQWTPDQRELTRRAAEEAGFPNVRLEDESIGALYSHLCDESVEGRPEPGGRVLMIDMGGGTTDFAFLEMPRKNKERPVSTPVDVRGDVTAWAEGQTSYGGRDVDRLLLEHFSSGWGDVSLEVCRPWLMREVRRFKEHFSDQLRQGGDNYETMWLINDAPRRVQLTREEFEEIMEDYIGHFPRLVQAALKAMNVAPRQVSHVLLTGGHSRWYWVDEALAEIFPHITSENGRLLRHPHPEQSVAKGLAYSPWVRSTGSRVLAPVRRAAHSLWLSVPYGVVEAQPEMTVAGDTVLIIKRGSSLPYRMSHPVRFRVKSLNFDAKEATVRVRFHLGTQTSNQTPLYDRVTRFERGFLESTLKNLRMRLPWVNTAEEDEFDVLVLCRVDENELLHAEVAVTRYCGGKVVATERQRVNLEAGKIPPVVPPAPDPPSGINLVALRPR